MRYAIESLTTKLSEARKNAGLSQSELGSKLGVPQSYISAIENGKRDLRLSTFLDLARGLGFELMLVPSNMVPVVSGLLEKPSEKKPQSLYGIADSEDEYEDYDL